MDKKHHSNRGQYEHFEIRFSKVSNQGPQNWYWKTGYQIRNRWNMACLHIWKAKLCLKELAHIWVERVYGSISKWIYQHEQYYLPSEDLFPIWLLRIALALVSFTSLGLRRILWILVAFGWLFLFPLKLLFLLSNFWVTTVVDNWFVDLPKNQTCYGTENTDGKTNPEICNKPCNIDLFSVSFTAHWFIKHWGNIVIGCSYYLH